MGQICDGRQIWGRKKGQKVAVFVGNVVRFDGVFSFSFFFLFFFCFWLNFEDLFLNREVAVNLIIRPQRAHYGTELRGRRRGVFFSFFHFFLFFFSPSDVRQLGPDEFSVAGRDFIREEIDIKNGRGLTLKCSW